jgi:hypothetical protein
MKPHHASALALGFWLFLVPPLQGEHVDFSAPMRHWRVAGHLFDSLADCQGFKAKMIANQDSTQELLKAPFPEKVNKNIKQAFSASTCVSSDDARLNEAK